MPHDGVIYLAFCALAVVVGTPVVWLVQRARGGADQEGDDGVWTVVVVALFLGVWWATSR